MADDILNLIMSIPDNTRGGRYDVQNVHASLMGGNCGVFAVSLKRIFGKGRLIAVISDIEPEYLFHVYLGVDGELYDSHGKRSKSDVLSKWNKDVIMKKELIDEYELGKNSVVKFELGEVDENYALRYTDGDYEVDELVTLLTGL